MTTAPQVRDLTDRELEILSVTANLFRHRGYAGVGIDDIGEALGVTGPALYRYFPTKQSLLGAIVEDFVHSVEKERGIQAARVGTEHGAHVVEAALTVGFAKADALLVYLRQLRRLDEPMRTEMRVRARRLEEGWDATLSRRGGDHARSDHGVRTHAIGGAIAHLSLTKHLTSTARRAMARDVVDAILETDLGDGPAGPDPVGHGDGPPLIAKNRREAILQVATRLFRERGYNGVSLREIGQEVGIGPSAVSRQFDSKDRILAVAFDRASAQIMGGIIAAINRSATAEEAALNTIHTYARTAMECRDLIAISATERHFLPDAEQRRRSQGAYIVELAHLLRQAHRDTDETRSRARAGCLFSVINEVILDDRLVRRPALLHELTRLGAAIVGLPVTRQGTALIPGCAVRGTGCGRPSD
ncbi:TetR/AcrR family transcriptional regulator [Pseudonocardia sp. C8]|uniref:TetR/AcrR family transcriptional regulator n=1 Tax=Pseudonocardia sp. C8 TaxID=2762759 RepID=UPI0016428713|nr:TetR/AcrR family transcriptional regulator [Pseudonocardia sp. C8]MBC3192989.1 TetR/AcrR family transcriptional regulator [Pseudonocardia sp. C8]